MKVIVLNSRSVIFYENVLPFSLRSHSSLVSYRESTDKTESMQHDRYLCAHKRATAIDLELITPNSNASD